MRLTRLEMMSALSNQYSEETLKKMTTEEIRAEYELYCDTDLMFPNDDQYDGSHEWD